MLSINRNTLSKPVIKFVQSRGRGATGATKEYYAPEIANLQEKILFLGEEIVSDSLDGVIRGFGRAATLHANTVIGKRDESNAEKWDTTYTEGFSQAAEGITSKAKLLDEQNKLTALIVAISTGAASGATSVTLDDGTVYAIPQSVEGNTMMSALVHMSELGERSKKIAAELLARKKASEDSKDKPETDEDNDND